MKTKYVPLALCLLAATACGRVSDVGQVPAPTDIVVTTTEVSGIPVNAASLAIDLTAVATSH